MIADRRATSDFVCMTSENDDDYEWDNEDIDLCDRSSWEEGTGEKIYKARYQFKYDNGILDTYGTIIEQQTINEYVSEEDFYKYNCN